MKLDLLASNFNTDHIKGSNMVNAGIDVEFECRQEQETPFPKHILDQSAQGDFGHGIIHSIIANDIEIHEQGRKRSNSIDLLISS